MFQKSSWLLFLFSILYLTFSLIQVFGILILCVEFLKINYNLFLLFYLVFEKLCQGYSFDCFAGFPLNIILGFLSESLIGDLATDRENLSLHNK